MAKDIDITINVKQNSEPKDSLYAFKMKVEVKDNNTGSLYEIEVPYGAGEFYFEGKENFVKFTKQVEQLVESYGVNTA